MQKAARRYAWSGGTVVPCRPRTGGEIGPTLRTICMATVLPLLLPGCGLRNALSPASTTTPGMTDATWLNIGHPQAAEPACQSETSSAPAINACIDALLPQIDAGWRIYVAGLQLPPECPTAMPADQAAGHGAASQSCPAGTSQPGLTRSQLLNSLGCSDSAGSASTADVSTPILPEDKSARTLQAAAALVAQNPGKLGHLFSDFTPLLTTAADLGPASNVATVTQMVTDRSNACLTILKRKQDGSYTSIADAAIDLYAYAIAGTWTSAQAALSAQGYDNTSTQNAAPKGSASAQEKAQ